MIKLLDGSLGVINLFEKDEVLSVDGGWVEVLTLTHLNRHHWTSLFENAGHLSLSDLTWHILHKQVRLEGLT